MAGVPAPCRGDDAELELTGERRIAPGVPPRREPAPVALDPLGRSVVGRVTGARAEVEEERLLVIDGAQVGQELDGPVGEVGAQVVAVLDGARRSDGVVVVVEGGNELMGLTAVEPVPAVEPACQRPGRARRGHVRLVLGAQVPLADGIGGVPVRSEDLREEAVLPRRPAPIPGKTARQVGHAAHPAAVMVPPRDQAGACGRAECGRVEIAEPDAVVGQGVDPRRVDVGSVATELRESHVVQHDEHDVGRALRRRRYRRPPRLRVAPVIADLAAKFHCLLHHPTTLVDTAGRAHRIGGSDPETATANGSAGRMMQPVLAPAARCRLRV